MVNTKEYVTQNNQYISVGTVEQSKNRIVTVLPGSGYNEFNSKNEETGELEIINKPYITVELDKQGMEWTLNKTTNERLGEELGTFETDNWVGAQLKLLIDKQGQTKYVTATVIKQPDADPLEEIEEVVSDE